jgi:hypothetical protein
MFKVIEYRRVRTSKAAASKFTRRKTIAEFPTLEAARKFSEGKFQTIIQYPKKYVKEMQA